MNESNQPSSADFTVSQSKGRIFLDVLCGSMPLAACFVSLYMIISGNDPGFSPAGNVIFVLALNFGWCCITYFLLNDAGFKLKVENEVITVFWFTKKSFSFTFDEIVSAKLNNGKNGEWIAVETLFGKKLIVSHYLIGYGKFKERIINEVPCDRLINF